MIVGAGRTLGWGFIWTQQTHPDYRRKGCIGCGRLRAGLLEAMSVFFRVYDPPLQVLCQALPFYNPSHKENDTRLVVQQVIDKGTVKG